ncbi:MAG: outer membrane beta-barrel protein [Ignavibacteriae bacterium]|nr:outer membrane beta-barrel protein [Ignavibacteria bacterium]MBI3363881.1 outer membrane beta-barrel protein [Ignavibacteriota bacterium]
MKNIVNISLTMVALVALIVSVGSAQIAPEKKLNIRAVSDGSILVGANSTDSKAGPYFGGSVAYGLGSGASLYVESGYGWTNYQSADGVKLVSIPVLGGVTYNFGQLLNSNIVQPYIGASGGVFNYLRQQDGTTITVSGNEQKTTSFGLEGIAGVSFKVNEDVAIDIRGKYDHTFSKRDNGNSLESQEWSNVGIGGGISYNFSF